MSSQKGARHLFSPYKKKVPGTFFVTFSHPIKSFFNFFPNSEKNRSSRSSSRLNMNEESKMPRALRIIGDNMFYHVLNRGNSKRVVFFNEWDYKAFIELLRKSKEKYSVEILAYCLMPNHFHIVCMPKIGEELSKWMHQIENAFVKRHHMYYQTTGLVWQGRFKDFPVQNDEHFLTLIRYVERNPVRAHLVSSALDWRWSSIRERIYRSKNRIIRDSPVILPEKWKSYVDKPLTSKELEEIRICVNRQSPYGSSKWKKAICKSYGLEQSIRPRGRPRKNKN
jgi:putative transposase